MHLIWVSALHALFPLCELLLLYTDLPARAVTGRTAAHLFGLVAAAHVLGDVLHALDGLLDLGRHGGKRGHRVEALGAQQTGQLPRVRHLRGFLPGALVPSTALYGGELTVPEVQAVQGPTSDLLGGTLGTPNARTTSNR